MIIPIASPRLRAINAPICAESKYDPGDFFASAFLSDPIFASSCEECGEMRPKEEDVKLQTGTFILSEKIDDTKSKKNEKEMKKEMKRLEKEKQEREKREKKAREKEKEREKQAKRGILNSELIIVWRLS